MRSIKYAQFLKLLKRNLDDNVMISSSFVCQHYLPAFLLNAMSEVLDYVILAPSSQNVSAEGNALAPRVYTDSVATCLLNTNFPRSKIILGLPTGGMLVDPSSDRESSSSLIPYGNVSNDIYCFKKYTSNPDLTFLGLRASRRATTTL
uniref:(northern house mosquito) hypothetical protein n=1 Tax=Culex pipiens TaxID=7175 RepID=A0A8D8KTX8_CULPI